MAIFTQRLVLGATPPPGELQPIFTAQPGHITIVRDVVVTNSTTAAVDFELFVHPGSGYYWLAFLSSIPQHSSVHIDMRQEIVVGEQLVVRSNAAAGAVTYAITGYVFDA